MSRYFKFNGPRKDGLVQFTNSSTMKEIRNIISKGKGKQLPTISYDILENNKNYKYYLPNVPNEYVEELLRYVKQNYMLSMQTETYNEMKKNGIWNFKKKQKETIEKFKDENNRKWNDEKAKVYITLV